MQAKSVFFGCCLFVCFVLLFQTGEIIACLSADGNDWVKGDNDTGERRENWYIAFE